MIVATVVEISVNLIMGYHVYIFYGHYFIQKNGGPIGIRSTASFFWIDHEYLRHDLDEANDKGGFENLAIL